MTPTDLPPNLARLARQMQTLKAQYLDHLGIGTGQALILARIYSNYGITQTQLCRMLGLDKSTVTRAVNRLVEAGYVEKRRNPADRRSHQLMSTNIARVWGPQFELADKSLMKALIIDFNEEEIEQFGIFLRRASANVHHVLHSPPVTRFSRLINNPSF
ncbi:MAG: winged helix-turn-helix transcriptional regulator [Candidatus Krumholzibacteria bacterium]|nr:winged helix-turn-helix transcriptional regulator [Candidatus Krumholzibacteria bacterium]